MAVGSSVGGPRHPRTQGFHSGASLTSELVKNAEPSQAHGALVVSVMFPEREHLRGRGVGAVVSKVKLGEEGLGWKRPSLTTSFRPVPFYFLLSTSWAQTHCARAHTHSHTMQVGAGQLKTLHGMVSPAFNSVKYDGILGFKCKICKMCGTSETPSLSLICPGQGSW